MLSLSSHGISAAASTCSTVFAPFFSFTVESTEDNFAAVGVVDYARSIDLRADINHAGEGAIIAPQSGELFRIIDAVLE
jgi:hypothetical protein